MNVKFCSFDNEIQTENPLVIADSYNECVRETLQIGEFSVETLEDMVTTPNIEEVMGFSVKQMLVQGQFFSEHMRILLVLALIFFILLILTDWWNFDGWNKQNSGGF